MSGQLLHQGKEILAGLLHTKTLRTLTTTLMLFLPVFLPQTVLAQTPTTNTFTDTHFVYFPCGSINTGPAGTSSTEDSAAATCFFQAYQACQPATISANFIGIDAGARRQFFIVKEPSHCLVVDVVENYVLPKLTSDHTYLCNSIQQETAGLLVKGCGQDGDVLLPASYHQ